MTLLIIISVNLSKEWYLLNSKIKSWILKIKKNINNMWYKYMSIGYRNMLEYQFNIIFYACNTKNNMRKRNKNK